MDGKPKAIKLVRLEEEQLPSGRKLLHCFFKDRYGNLPHSYRWTAPYRGRDGDYGIENLFLKSIQVEEYNDYSGVWTQELKKVAEEIPLLDEMKLPVEIEIGGAIEDTQENDTGISEEYWKIRVEISRGEQDVSLHEEQGKQYLTIGQVNMAWKSLHHEISQTKEVEFISDEMSSLDDVDNAGYIVDTACIYFWLWLKKTADRVQYQVATRDISFRIRSFIRSRLSEYKSLKKGFQEQ
jgi:hypothetical protein